MRKKVIYLIALSVIATVTIVSLRDKEIVLTVPGKGSLIAEAYHAITQPSSPFSFNGLKNILNPSKVQNTPASSPALSFIPYEKTPNSYITPFSSENVSGELALTSLPVVATQAPAPAVTKQPDATAAPQVVYYGLGGLVNVDTGSDANGTNTGAEITGTVNSVSGGSGDTPPAPEVTPSSPAPVFITGILPEHGIPGTEVVIQGAGFHSDVSKDVVEFGAVAATSVSFISKNQLRATIPAGLSSGRHDVTVTVNGTESRPFNFNVLRDAARNVFIEKTAQLIPAALSAIHPSLVKTGDIDNDLDPDMFIIDRAAEKAYLLANDGSGAYADVTNTNLPALSSVSDIADMAFTDINNDGYLDIILANSAGQLVTLLVNGGMDHKGIFTDATADSIPALSGYAIALDTGDVTGDGYPDIVIANRTGRDILLVNNAGGVAGVFSQDEAFDLPDVIDGSSDIKICDIDGDGDLDILTTNNAIVGTASLRTRAYVNDGSGLFTDATAALLPNDTRYNEALDVGDIDIDGDTDIVIASDHQNSVFIQKADHTFEDGTVGRVQANAFTPRDTKLGDMNGDGYADILILGDSRASLLLNDGHGVFRDSSLRLPDYKSVPALKGGTRIELADIDGDGALDIVTAGNALTVLKGIAENKPPVLNPIGNREAEAGASFTFNVTAADPNGDNLVYLAENLPAGASFLSQLFSWTPGPSDIGKHEGIRFTARESAATALEDSEEISITVSSGNLPVIDYYVPMDKDLELEPGELVQFGVRAHDPRDEALTFTWFFNGEEVTALNDATSSLVFIFPKYGENTVEVRVSNSVGTVSVNWDVGAGVPVNHPPVITSYVPTQPSVNIDLDVGGAINFGITASDPDAGDELAYVWKFDGVVISTNASLSASAYAGRATVGTHIMEVSVSDGVNDPVTHQWTVIVTQTPVVNHPPVINSSSPSAAAVSLMVAESQAFSVDASDPDAGDTPAYAWTVNGNPVGSATNAHTFTAAETGQYTVLVSVTDGHSAPVTRAWTVTVTPIPVNHQPVIETYLPAQETVSLLSGAAQDFSVVASDPDAGDIITYSWMVNGNPVGSSTSAFTLTETQPGQYIVAVIVSDGVTSPAIRQWTVTISQQNLAPVIETSVPPLDTVGVITGDAQSFSIVASDPDAGDKLSYTWTVDGFLVGSSTDSYIFTSSQPGQHSIAVAVYDGHNTAVTRQWTVTVQEPPPPPSALEDIVKHAFQFFWNEADSSTGLVRDRILADAEDPSIDANYSKASVAATGFGFTALCVAAEKYGDGSDPDWQTTPQALADRAETTLDTLLMIQGNQAAGGDGIWGKSGFFYHFVNINDGMRWTASEVSSVDTALLIAGAIAAGEYFKDINPDVQTKARQLYANVDWKSFLDMTPGPNYGQFYKAWVPNNPGHYDGHWDYIDESILLYFLGVGSPTETYAVDPDFYYSAIRELGQYGADGKALVQTWFGSLFAYQFVHAFFDLRDVHDAQHVSWWQNTVDATKANRQFCIDQDSSYGYNQNVWGLSSVYEQGAVYAGNFGAPPLKNPGGATHNGFVNPSVVACAAGMLPQEALQTVTSMKTDQEIWHEDKYGFVDSFKNADPRLYADFFVGISLGSALAMVANETDGGVVRGHFMDGPTRYGTMRDVLTELAFKDNADSAYYVTTDDISPKSQFMYGLIDAGHPEAKIKFTLESVTPGRPHILAIHTFMNNSAGSYDVGVTANLNGDTAWDVTFSHIKDKEDEIIYLELPAEFMKVGENIVTLTRQGGASWLAWKNLEVSSPTMTNTWRVVRSLHGNEYRTDDTYYPGHADASKYGADAYKTFEQALNAVTDPYTEILFYMDDLTYDRNLVMTTFQSDGVVYGDVIVNGEVVAGNIAMGTGQPIAISADHLDVGWNCIRLQLNKTGGEWIIWDTVSLQFGDEANPLAPRSVSAAPYGPDKVNIRWELSQGADIRYNLYRSQSKGGPYVKVNATDISTTTYQDNGLQDRTSYYYVVTSFKAAAPSNESTYSNEVTVATGDYAVDYRDGKDPNAFGGGAGASFRYLPTNRHDLTYGAVRAIALNPSETGWIGLNNADMSQASVLSLWIDGTGSEKIDIGLRDSASHEASVNVTAASGWQNLRINLSDFSGVSKSGLDRLYIRSTSPAIIGIALDDIVFIREASSAASLTVVAKSISDNSRSTGVNFDNPSGADYAPAGQYLEVTYGISATDWKIWIYTKNTNVDPDYMTEQYGGLISSNGRNRIPVLWRVYPDVQQGGVACSTRSDVYNGDSLTWSYLKDRNDIDWYAANQKGAEYSVVCYGGDTWAHLSVVPPGSGERDPVDATFRVYVGGIFKDASVGDYATTAYFDITHE